MASKLPPLPSLRDFVHIYRLTARKILSQNYLMDMNINKKIVRKAGIDDGAYVVEIGPGPGGITRAVLEHPVKRLDIIELDTRFIPALEALVDGSENRLFIHNEDALKIDIKSVWESARVPKHDWLDESPNLHILGNLPFNISTPLIIKYLREMSRRQGPWAFGRVPLTLTFQLDVAKRICARICTKERARISLITQYVSDPSILFTIPGSSFTPKPKVDVGVVQFVPRIESLVPVDFDVVQKVIRHAFMYKNKWVIKSIKTLYPKDMANDLALELLRYARVNPENVVHNIGMEELSNMCIKYEQQCRRHPGLFPYVYTNKKHSLETLKNDRNAIPPIYGFLIPELNKEGVSLKEFDSKWIPIAKN